MKTIDNDIKSGEFKKAYLLFGEEGYLIRQYRDKLKNALVASDDTMNFSSYEGKDIEQTAIIDLAETLPFFADKRVVLIENSGLFEKGGDVLGEYMPSVPDSTCFIFCEESVDKRSKLFKAVSKLGSAIEFKEMPEETLARWIGSRIKKEGKGMTRAAYNLFISKTGTDMENIDKELEKLICYCIDKDMIEEQDVEAITTEQLQDKIFDMVDCIASQRQRQALDLYYDLLALKVPAMRILYMISKQFNRLLIVKSMTNQGFRADDIATKAGCPKWSVPKYQKQCKPYAMDRIKEAVRDGAQFEEDVKTGRIGDQIAVEMFIVKYSAQ